MKKSLIGLISLLVGCGPNRDFEGKNIFGSQTSVGVTVTSSVSSTSSGDGQPSWPQENVGYNIGQTISESLTWPGYLEGDPNTSQLNTLSPHQWYDPDGSKSINAVLVITSKYECSACASEAKQLQNLAEDWSSQGLGIKIVVLMTTNSEANGPPTTSSTFQWKSQYGLIGVAVGVDPNFTFSISSAFATPLHTIINPRDMKVVDVQEGNIEDYSTLESTANENK